VRDETMLRWMSRTLIRQTSSATMKDVIAHPAQRTCRLSPSRFHLLRTFCDGNAAPDRSWSAPAWPAPPRRSEAGAMATPTDSSPIPTLALNDWRAIQQLCLDSYAVPATAVAVDCRARLLDSLCSEPRVMATPLPTGHRRPLPSQPHLGGHRLEPSLLQRTVHPAPHSTSTTGARSRSSASASTR